MQAPDLSQANWLLLAALRMTSSQLHLRNKRVSETLALPTLAAQHEVLSLSLVLGSAPRRSVSVAHRIAHRRSLGSPRPLLRMRCKPGTRADYI